MSWFPESIWTPDITRLANLQPNPHTYFDPFCFMSAAAWNTKKITMGIGVTDTFRHHPAVLAQSILTLDHISKGRFILGLGAGEGVNTIPYGINMEKPVSRLEESIKIIKLLWENDQKVDFEGKFWNLKDAVLGLGPYKKGKYPPIWIGAHGPKMLEMTGRLADGWLPTLLPLRDYREGCEVIHDTAKKAGRKPNDITKGIMFFSVFDKDHKECLRILDTKLIKNFLLVAPDWFYKKYGYSHPFGDGYIGLYQYISTRLNREKTLEAIEKIPMELVEKYFLFGTPDEVIKKIEEYIKIGLNHIVFTNLTALGDPSKFKTSTICLKEIINYFKN
jgi:phthiodiolone/phenolphthiodiolone dimycocerosates ketoreductase